jgi:hypothetical protein
VTKVAVGALDPGDGVGLDDALERLRRALRHEHREVVRRVRDLGVLPAGDRPDRRRLRVLVVRERHEEPAHR